MSSYDFFFRDNILLENKRIVLQQLQFFYSIEIVELPVFEQFSSPLTTSDMYHMSLSIQSVTL